MLGLLLGPGYFIFSTYLSGSPAQSYPMTERGTRWTLPDGSILRTARGQAYRPLEVELKPEMNRIRLSLVFEIASADSPAAAGGTDSYLATLMQQDQSILHRNVELPASERGSETIRLGTIEVYYPGKYLFILEGPDAPKAPVSRVVLEVEQNVKTLFPPILVVGAMMLVVGIALYLEPLLPKWRA